MNEKEIINELGKDIVNLIESYKGKLHSQEVGNQLISIATSMMLYCAPNELVGMKTILICVENGINSYEESQS